MLRIRATILAVAIAVAFAAIAPGLSYGADPDDVMLTATLDGKPIPLTDVSKYYCDDFSYPTIRCSSTALLASTRATVLTLLADVDYVTIFEQPGYGGSWMNVSQDYSVLAVIGWNDRISSFKGRNSETGRFWVDWFYGGNGWNICCNGQVSSLGSFDNTFSSVERT